MRALLACLFLLWTCATTAQTVLRVGVPEGSLPYEPLVQAIYQEAGLQVQFLHLPAERSLRMLDQGDLDADLGRVPAALAQYPNVVLVRESVVQAQLLAVVRQDFALGTPSPQTLRQWRLGSVRGMKMAQTYLQDIGAASTEVNTAAQMYQMLQAGRIDLALDLSTMLDASPELPGAGLRVLPTPLATTPVYHVLHKRWAHLVPRLEASIRALRSDGRSQRILARIRAGTAP